MFKHKVTGDRYVIKSAPEAIFEEYISAPFFQAILGKDRAPEIVLVENDGSAEFSRSKILIGSKLLENFTALANLIDTKKRGDIGIKQCFGNHSCVIEDHALKSPYTTDHPGYTTIDHQPFFGMEEVEAALVFLQETDPHWNNLGVINHNAQFTMCKIDHSHVNLREGIIEFQDYIRQLRHKY